MSNAVNIRNTFSLHSLKNIRYFLGLLLIVQNGRQ